MNLQILKSKFKYTDAPNAKSECKATLGTHDQVWLSGFIDGMTLDLPNRDDAYIQQVAETLAFILVHYKVWPEISMTINMLLFNIILLQLDRSFKRTRH